MAWVSLYRTEYIDQGCKLDNVLFVEYKTGCRLVISLTGDDAMLESTVTIWDEDIEKIGKCVDEYRLRESKKK